MITAAFFSLWHAIRLIDFSEEQAPKKQGQNRKDGG